MKRKVSGIALLLTSIIGVNVVGGQLFAQQPAVVYDSYRYEQLKDLSGMDQRAADLVTQLRNKPDAAKEAELKKLVEELFDKRHAAQVAEAKALAEKLAKLQETLKKRQAKKDEIVTRHVKQLLGEADDLDWNPTPLYTPQPSVHGTVRGGTPYYDPTFTPKPKTPPEGWNADALRMSNNGPAEKSTPRPGGAPPSPDVFTPLQDPTQKSPDKSPFQPTPRPPTANSNTSTKSSSDDIKTLEIELALAKVKLLEVDTTHQNNIKSGVAVSGEELNKSRFAVEKMKLEVDLAARRLEIANEKSKPEPKTAPGSQSRPENQGR